MSSVNMYLVVSLWSVVCLEYGYGRQQFFDSPDMIGQPGSHRGGSGLPA